MKSNAATLIVGVLQVLALSTSHTEAATFSWNTLNGFYSDSTSWASTLAGSSPGASDTALFAVNKTYVVLIAGEGQANNVTLSTGNVTLIANSGNSVVPALDVISSVASTVSLPNANGGTSLTLGTSSHPAVLRASILDVENGAAMFAFYGSELDADVCKLNGSLYVSGSRMSTHSGSGQPWNVGLAGGTGTLAFINGSAGFPTGPLLIADDATSSTGEVDLSQGSIIGLGGDLTMATHNLAGQTAIMYIDSTDSALTQFNDPSNNPTSISVGSVANGSAAIYIGTIVSGGTLNTGTGGLYVRKTGAVVVGGSSTTGTFNANSDVYVEGGLLQVFSGSSFNLASGKTLHILSGTVDFKSFNINGSSIDFSGGSLSYAGNLEVGTGGPLGPNLTLNSDRQLSLTGTTAIDPSRVLFIAGGTLHTGAFVNNGGLTVYYGTLTTGAATLAAGSLLDIGLGGIARNSQYGALVSSGSVTLGGTLSVVLNSFMPTIGDSFDILDWGTRTGTFSSITLPSLAAGRAWDTSQLYTTGVISVIASAGVAGDYNSNGIVDAADYVAWRNNQGTTHVLPNDPIGGTIGVAQYNQWRAHFGQSAGGGSKDSLLASSVPEPASMILVALEVLGSLTTARRARTSPAQNSSDTGNRR